MNRHNQSLTLKLAITLGVAVGIFLLFSWLAGTIYDYPDSVPRVGDPPEVQAIVCLAGGRGRIRAAGDLWFRYFSRGQKPILYFSGLGPDTSWPEITKLLRPRVLEVLKPEWVHLETRSTNTVENARELEKYLSEKALHHLVLVTSSYHMKRSLVIFRKTLGPSAQIETYTASLPPYNSTHWFTRMNSIAVTYTEFIKWFYYSYL